MIEVNLLPGGRKRAARGMRPSFALPKFGNFSQDRWVVGAAGAAILGILISGWLFLSLGSQREEVDFALEVALQDSAVYTDLVTRTTALLNARDSIVERVGIIQGIDRGRFVWPHIMDEVARALPDYTWLDQIQQVSDGANPVVRLVGQAGTIQAVTIFIDQLESSPFLRDVDFVSSSQVLEADQTVYAFELEATFEQPPMEFLQTVPLLEVPEDAVPAPPGL